MSRSDVFVVWRFGRCAKWVVLLAGLWSGWATASPASDPMVAAAREAIVAGRVAQGLRLAEAAARVDPADARAAFFQASALNRLARPAEALDQVRRSQLLGLPADFVGFEKGWAYLQLGEFDQAIRELSAYTQAHPDDAKATEFLGRAYLGAGQPDDARAILHQAATLDPSLSDTTDLAIARIDAEEGDADAARDRLARAARSAPGDSPLTDPLRVFADQPVAVQKAEVAEARRFRGGVTVGVGYNSNVVALDDDLALPEGISGRGSAMGTLAVDLAYDPIRTDTDILTLGYLFQGELFEGDLKDFDLLDQYFYLDWAHSLTDRLSTMLRVADEWTHIGGNGFRNQISVRPAITANVNQHLSVEAAYTYAANDYQFPTTAEADRDSDVHTVGLALAFRVPHSDLVGRAGYSHSFHITEGSEFDRDDDTVFVSLSHPLPMDFQLTGRYLHVFADYQDPSAFGDGTDARDDDIDVVGFTLSRWFDLDVPVIRGARWFVNYDFTNNDSNVAVFEYDQHRVTTGVTLAF